MGCIVQQMLQAWFLMRTYAMPETPYEAVSRPMGVPAAGQQHGRIPRARVQLPRAQKIAGV